MSKSITPNQREIIAAQGLAGIPEYLTSTSGALNVNATLTPSGTQDTNLTKVGGASISLGQKTSANSLPITIASDQSTLPVNMTQLNGVATASGNGIAGTGVQRVAIASDNTAFPVNATLSAETTKVIGTVNQGTSPWVTSLASTTITGTVATTQSTSPWIVSGSGTAGSAASGVVTIQGIASMTKLLVTPDSVALPANQSVNVAQMNGVTTSMGNGTTDTGTQRVSISSDSTGTIKATGSATGSAVPAGAFYMGLKGTSNNLTGLNSGGTNSDAYDGSAAIQSVTYIFGSGGSGFDRARAVSPTTNSSGTGIVASALLAQLDDTSPTTITENQFGNLRMSGDRSLLVANRATTPTQTSVAGATGNTNILVLNASRKGGTIFNDSSAIMYVKLGTTASTTSYSAQLVSNAYYEIPFGYIGNIDAVWVSATGNARITELN